MNRQIEHYENTCQSGRISVGPGNGTRSKTMTKSDEFSQFQILVTEKQTCQGWERKMRENSRVKA